MYRKGHLGIAGIVAGVLPWALPVNLWIALTSVILFFERVPDKDQILPLIAHRGYSHTLIGAVAVGSFASISTLSTIIYPTPIGLNSVIYGTTPTGELVRALAIIIWVGAILGFTTHIIGDMITVGTDYYGVKPFAPFNNWQCGIQLCKAGNERWNNIFFEAGATVLTISIITKAALEMG